MYAHHPLEVLESRIDWLTSTVKPGERQTIIKGRVNKWMEAREAEGYVRKAFQTPFYKGEKIDGIAWGEREDDAMLVLSGALAGRHGATAVTWADGVSRLDVQVTLREPDLLHDWARYVDHLAGLLPEVKAGALTTRLYSQRPEGITSYIGDGASTRMLRVYDKYAESDHTYPMGSWRWEVQYRHQRALVVARKLLDGNKLPQTCLDCVCAAFRDYKIYVPALCLPSGWLERWIPQRSDDERRLAWLKRSIAPCIERLRENHNTDVVLDALGLNDVIDTLEGQAQLILVQGETIERAELAWRVHPGNFVGGLN
jgi:hypothetical protein